MARKREREEVTEQGRRGFFKRGGEVGCRRHGERGLTGFDAVYQLTPVGERVVGGGSSRLGISLGILLLILELLILRSGILVLLVL
jgi:hypothetical protein